MQQKTRWITFVSLLILFAAAASGGFFFGKTIEKKRFQESAYILEAAGLKTPELLKNAAGLNMVLVGHSEYTQSADGLKDAKIISIIDHHGDRSVTTANPLIYGARPIGSNVFS